MNNLDLPQIATLGRLIQTLENQPAPAVAFGKVPATMLATALGLLVEATVSDNKKEIAEALDGIAAIAVYHAAKLNREPIVEGVIEGSRALQRAAWIDCKSITPGEEGANDFGDVEFSDGADIHQAQFNKKGAKDKTWRPVVA